MMRECIQCGKWFEALSDRKSCSEECRYKLVSKKLVGRIFSDATKKKMSENHADFRGENSPLYGQDHSGMNNGMYGKHHTDQSKEKMRGKRPSMCGDNNPSRRKDVREKLAGPNNGMNQPGAREKQKEACNTSEWMEKHNTPEAKANRKAGCNTPEWIASHSGENNAMRRPEVAAKVSAKNKVIMNLPEIRKKFSGSNNGNWRGGIPIEYCEKWEDPELEVHERIRVFFDYRCTVCGMPQEENGRALNCHHVEYNKQACCDGQEYCFAALCTSCHGKTNGSERNRQRWKEIFHKIIDEIYDGRSYLTLKEWKDMQSLPG